jgi:hypothetical protein
MPFPTASQIIRLEAFCAWKISRKLTLTRNTMKIIKEFEVKINRLKNDRCGTEVYSVF